MRAVDAVIAALAAFPGEPVSWIVGEPCFEPPPELSDALARASESPTFSYPPPGGTPALRKVLAERFEEEELTIAADQITVTSGAKCGLLALFEVFVIFCFGLGLSFLLAFTEEHPVSSKNITIR